uniref:AlNc14C71G4876 protein n=1 Tax=Albugo laibachii Nc14 TaxID=890382 RepID=F0WE11_9STRA|nr:AlNc14C71G4876 [Albugo laibachii Nc14]|eukprot:CCA19440.1 AlNc14C71G4876 [Albugo laibachii Nc14]
MSDVHDLIIYIHERNRNDIFVCENTLIFGSIIFLRTLILRFDMIDKRKLLAIGFHPT